MSRKLATAQVLLDLFHAECISHHLGLFLESILRKLQSIGNVPLVWLLRPRNESSVLQMCAISASAKV